MPPVSEFMTQEVVSINPSKNVFEAADIMREKKIGSLVVIDCEVPVGIVTERDFVRRVIAKKLPLDVKISEIMSKPLITIDPDSSLRDAARLMIKSKVRRLPVVKDDKLVGIIVVSDFARQLSKKTINRKHLEAIVRKIKTEEILEIMEHHPYPS